MKNLKPKDINLIFIVVLIIGAVIGFYGAGAQNDILCFAGLFCMFGDIVFRLMFYRCPYCKRYLDRSEGKFCPHCGERIDK